MNIRVRIAPSPTGFLHIGTARTALFNWLYAHQQKGKFILRIEDTDLERSDVKFEKDIIEGLKWLGLNWDEGPIRQTDRLDIYEKYINQLLKEKKAYYCFCSKEELENERQTMIKAGVAPKYSGKCRSIPSEEAQKKVTAGENHIIRFQVPEIKISFKDLIRGEISFDMALVGDIAIAKDPRVPLYNFAVVIDDHEMKISHVIRGEDHIANTPKQIVIQNALNFPQPEYAHLPLILDPDRSKMSKRFSATSIQEYKNQGYLPEALFNFVSLLGWHPKTDQEILTKEETIQEFDIHRIQKAGAIFNQEKLDWTNSQYLKKMEAKEILERIKTISSEPLAKFLSSLSEAAILKILETSKERMKKLTDLPELGDFFAQLPEYSKELLSWKETPLAETKHSLEMTLKTLEPINEKEFTKFEIEKILMPIAEQQGKGEILWPLRVDLSGKKASPGPLEIMDILGKKETLNRINLALEKLK